MATVEKRQTIGAAVRGILSTLHEKGLANELRGHVSPAAQKLLDNPPMHITWVDSTLVDELINRTAAIRDRETVREIGYQATRGSAGPVLLPMIKMFLSLSGSKPSSIFANLHRMVALEVRGLTAGYEPTGDRSGVVLLRFSEPVTPITFAVWEGALRFAYDVCKVQGTVGVAEVSKDGAGARLAVTW